MGGVQCRRVLLFRLTEIRKQADAQCQRHRDCELVRRSRHPVIARAVGLPLRPVDRRVMKLPPLRCAVPRMAALSPSVGDGALLALRGGGEASVLGARLVGWALTGAAVTLYIPMIAELVKNRSAPESMSATTWSLQLLGFVTTVIYHVRMGFPLSTFADFAAPLQVGHV